MGYSLAMEKEKGETLEKREKWESKRGFYGS